jgi:hypothetical protein
LIKCIYDLGTAHWESVRHALGGQTRRTVARMPRPNNLVAFRYTVKCSLDVAQARRMVNVGISVKRNEQPTGNGRHVGTGRKCVAH